MASKQLVYSKHPSRLVATVSGNLATGKTSLCKVLEGKFGQSSRLKDATVVYEEYEKNEHLPHFYSHLKEKGFVYNPHSYRTQLAFMEHRNDQLAKVFADKRRSLVVEDRSQLEFSEVFASCQAAHGLMSQGELDLYRQEIALKTIYLPDLLVFLSSYKAAVITRGRDIERDLAEEYLHQLDEFLQKYVERMAARGSEIVQPPASWLSNGFLTEEGSQKVYELIADRDQSKRKSDGNARD